MVIEMSKYLVVGGAGFIGGKLCDVLAKDPSNIVVSLDNYFTGRRSQHVPGVEYREGNSKDIFEICADVMPDYVFHLGEYSRVEQSFKDFDIVYDYNLLGTKEVIKFCSSMESKLIYAGSSTKFGDGGLGKNQSPYGWTKATNTELIINYSEWYALDYAIVYFYNAYGPGEMATGKYATLIGLYMEAMRNDDSLKIVQPGNQERNFTHVEDIVSGLILVGQCGVGDGYGIGSMKAYTVESVANMFGGKVEYIASRKGNRMTAPVLNTKTLALGWEIKWDLESYIKTTKLNGWVDS
tara:strand:+ start:2453 stop:3337 length:885 start_codon:yes stop_codon:yes gene_type:complete